MTARLAALMVVVAVTLVSARGLAQGVREAEIEFNRGELLLEMKDYPRAIFAFKKAYSIVPDNRYLAGLAKAFLKKGNKEKALVYAELYLERETRAPKKKVIDMASALRDELSEKAGRVEIHLFPPGGKLSVLVGDEKRETTVVDGARVVRWLPLGEATLVYEKESFGLRKVDVAVTRGETAEVDLLLDQAEGQGELVVDSSVDDSLVYIDGKEVGRTPLTQKVEAGDHVVQVWAQNHLAWTGVIDAAAHRAVSVKAKLTPSKTPVSAIPTATMVVDESGGWSMSTWGWITMGLGAAALGGAGYFYLQMFDKLTLAGETKDDDEKAQLVSEVNTLWILTLASGVGGGVATGGGLLMVLLDDSEEEAEATPFELLTISPSPRQGGFTLEAAWTF